VVVGPGVFIPRPETEVLVEWALQAIASVPTPVVIDLCSGTGAIALAVAQARPDARVHAVERAPGALAWARRNADLHRDAGGTPIDLRGGDFNDQRLLTDLDGTADLVTANPPYVPLWAVVEPEVSEHDPAEAVFGGADGLDVIRPLISVVAGLLKPGGVLAIEHDDTHGESVPALLAARRVLADVVDHPDLSGRPRFVTARRVTLPARARSAD
jgi:release factor glutamine methyltransferase